MGVIFLTPPLDVSDYCWLLEIGTSKVGVHRSDGWCMQLDERLVFFDFEDKFMLLAPILEIDVKEFSDFMKTAEILYPDYSVVIRRFPKELLLKYIFHTSCSGYWPEKALAWLIADKDIRYLFKDELEKLIDNKVMPQGARQKARKILNSIK